MKSISESLFCFFVKSWVHLQYFIIIVIKVQKQPLSQSFGILASAQQSIIIQILFEHSLTMNRFFIFATFSFFIKRIIFFLRKPFYGNYDHHHSNFLHSNDLFFFQKFRVAFLHVWTSNHVNYLVQRKCHQTCCFSFFYFVKLFLFCWGFCNKCFFISFTSKSAPFRPLCVLIAFVQLLFTILQ